MDDKIFDQVHDIDLKKNNGNLLYRLCNERYRFPCIA